MTDQTDIGDNDLVVAAREAVRTSLQCAAWVAADDVCEYDETGDPCGCREAAKAVLEVARKKL